MLWDLTILIEGANQLGYPLSQEQLSQFDRYLSLLLERNQHINLTAITKPVDIQTRLFLESLSCVVATGDLSNQSVVDVGSGAGFPGLPLKILFPQVQLTLLESVAKKARFLEEACQLLALPHVNIVVARAEWIGQNTDYRETFDWAVARAVAPLNSLVEYLLPLCKVDGHIIAQKGRNARAEVESALSAINLLGGGPAKLLSEPLHGVQNDGDGHANNVLVVIPKIKRTPDKYPRRIGVPVKRPL
ncbi:MAG: 16S rRNA (guanine(527)-N(7))-methyltransferase RsmG [Chloroflexota bacterium]|jgi:16S rRNA (guanine527-N7)-methyltransferase